MLVDHQSIKILFLQEKSYFEIPFHEPSRLPLILYTRSRSSHCGLCARIDIFESSYETIGEILTARTGLRQTLAELLPPEDQDGSDILSTVMDKQNAFLIGPQHKLLAWHYR